MSGSRPAPAQLRLAKGVRPGRDSGGRRVKPPPAFKRIPPDPPYQLSDYADDVWRRVVPELNRLELLKPIDGEQLAAYCEMCAAFKDAVAAVRFEGLTYDREVATGGVSVMANPNVATMIKLSADMRNWAIQFGLTPASESSLNPKADADDDGQTAAFA
jgi:P27 family predicted phage terminase small subunit